MKAEEAPWKEQDVLGRVLWILPPEDLMIQSRGKKEGGPSYSLGGVSKEGSLRENMDWP